MSDRELPLLVQRGKVIQGTHIAERIGFPTANIILIDRTISGTYAGKAVIGKSEYNAIIYANLKRKILEAHLFDFSNNLYGKYITIILLHRIAKVEKFRTTKEEKKFITNVASKTKKYLETHPYVHRHYPKNSKNTKGHGKG